MLNIGLFSHFDVQWEIDLNKKRDTKRNADQPVTTNEEVGHVVGYKDNWLGTTLAHHVDIFTRREEFRTNLY